MPGGDAPVVPVVRLGGVIGRASRLRNGLTLSSTAGVLKKAFDMKAAPAVALLIDSPGGSPVQSHLIYRRIRSLAEEKDKRVLVFVEDVCASGGYMIACAGDEIVVDPASIVGSIGVVSAGFGFVEAMNKIGVERRVYTSGHAKVILDPFQPEKPDDVARLKAIQEEVHDHFIDIVRSRRGDVLRQNDDIFSGMFWSGKTAVALGLADRTGEIRTVLREMFGEKVKMKLLGSERSFLPRRLGLESLAERATTALVAELEERALRSRFGL
ncbi:S49 family peptidase [Rhizobiales bacterium L72]|uniref:S49 family peptidase n=2 Tax=Propylenella binzhouense TaxID=2555902 RepID=A0A964T7G2_9HYPH|nr:S49 family peptidase [Propylenella binzhouense]MYZ49824.1 S49 family peptidase [Propylenella binzhouense]